jgi:hypothetical protein
LGEEITLKILKWAILVVAILFVISQFIRPAMTNPPVDETRTLSARLTVPQDVTNILERSCQDCHSNKTVWPWYSQVAPVSWLLVSDVNEGRRHLNFSDWASYDTTRAPRKLDQMCEQVDHGDMPLWFYLPLHPKSKLTDADKKTLCDWTKSARQTMPAAVSGPPR